MSYNEAYKIGAKLYTGDLDGDGVKEIITLPGGDNTAQVRTFSKDGEVLSQFFAYPQNVRGSFELAVGDVDGDGEAEIASHRLRSSSKGV